MQAAGLLKAEFERGRGSVVLLHSSFKTARWSLPGKNMFWGDGDRKGSSLNVKLRGWVGAELNSG